MASFYYGAPTFRCDIAAVVVRCVDCQECGGKFLSVSNVLEQVFLTCRVFLRTSDVSAMVQPPCQLRVYVPLVRRTRPSLSYDSRGKL